MTIRIKYFASLREHAGCGEELLEVPVSGLRVAQVWRRARGGEALPTGVFAAVNHQHADARQRVTDGDEVAFFPQVTGG